MSLRFFVDHCVSNTVMRMLRESGYEIFSVREHLPVESPDDVVFSNTQSLDAIRKSIFFCLGSFFKNKRGEIILWISPLGDPAKSKIQHFDVPHLGSQASRLLSM